MKMSILRPSFTLGNCGCGMLGQIVTPPNPLFQPTVIMPNNCWEPIRILYPCPPPPPIAPMVYPAPIPAPIVGPTDGA